MNFVFCHTNLFVLIIVFFGQAFSSPLTRMCSKTNFNASYDGYSEIAQKGSMTARCIYNSDGRLIELQRIDWYVDGYSYSYRVRFHSNGVIKEEFMPGYNGYGQQCDSKTIYNRDGMKIGSEYNCGRFYDKCTYAGNYRLKCVHMGDGDPWVDYEPVEYADD